MKKLCMWVMVMLWAIGAHAASPVKGLLERIDKGASQRFVIELKQGDRDFFELDYRAGKPVVRGNNYVSIATGIHWYLKYYAGIHLCWGHMHARLPQQLPAVPKPERHETDMRLRFDFNYCTHSYTMAFWDWARWEEEIDWMALHGVNMPLCATGMGSVWRNVLLRLGYTRDEVNDFVAGPAFQSWWLMNNLEGWGGPNPDSWYTRQEELQRRIVRRMREWGIEPVLPGYSGMLPANAKERLGVDVADPGRWCGYRRPAFLQPQDPNFQRIARIYYQELTRLYGKARYYSMDPFHEGGNTKGVDLAAAGKAVWQAMKAVNPKATWVAQAWQACPHNGMIAEIPEGDMVVLDLYSESCPQWGDSASIWYRPQGFGKHHWLYCMLLNFGGNVGLHGKMRHVIDEFYKARESSFGRSLKGIGLTMEGTENNPVMYELLTELPWRAGRFDKDEWLRGYLRARYGKLTPGVEKAWMLLSNTIYACPDGSTQQGTHESVFCARPSLNAYQVSSWSCMADYYQPMDIIRAANDIVADADAYRGNADFEYDLVDIVRQAVAEKGRLVYPVVVAAYKAADKELFASASARFLNLILLQDRLLATHSNFKVGRWIGNARRMGATAAESDLYEWNARVQVATWGNRHAAEQGGLHDYAHKEWNGMLRDYYYIRWKAYFDELAGRLEGKTAKHIDFYAMEEAWTLQHNVYAEQPEGDPIEVAKQAMREICK